MANTKSAIKTNRRILRQTLVNKSRKSRFRNAIKKINCSTLCIFGDLDKMVPLEVGNKMASMIKNSEKKIINNCGHMIIFEKAFEMRNLVKEFLTR